MKLLVVSHKPCWRTDDGSIATDGGFPLQMATIASLFDATTVCVPVAEGGSRPGETVLAGPNLRVVPLPEPRGRGLTRKLLLLAWLAQSLRVLLREARRADAVHAPVPGDVGTAGILVAELLRKPLFVRHCGNWAVRRTVAERTWGWYMERFAGPGRAMLATGGSDRPPSDNTAVRWIFSTSLRAADVERLRVIRSLPDPEATIRLVIVGRQVSAKGTPVALDAVADLVRRGLAVHLDVVGDGPELEDFVVRAKELDIAEAVTFHGRLSQPAVLDVVAGAHVLVFPTTSSEGFPKVVAESLACGVPVVSTAVSVIPHLLARGGGRVVAATGGAVADAVMELVGDRDGYARASRDALETAADLTLERWAENIEEALRQAWDRPLRGSDSDSDTDRSLRTVVVAGPLLSGNAGWVLTQGELLGARLAREGLRVKLTSPIPSRPLRLLDTVLSLLRWGRSADVVVVQVFSGLGFVMADLTSRLARMLGAPVVFHLHGGGLPDLAARRPEWVATVLRRGRCVAPSAFLARALTPLAGDIEVIPNLLPAEPQPVPRASLRPRILWMRTFHPIYEPDVAVRALAALRAEGVDATLTMAGQEKGSGEATRALADELGVAAHVRFAGFLDADAKRVAFEDHDIFWNTTRVDNAPVSLVEAAAHGLVVVSTDPGGIRDLFEDGASAALVPVGDALGLARVTAELLADRRRAEVLRRGGDAVARAWLWPELWPRWRAVLDAAR